MLLGPLTGDPPDFARAAGDEGFLEQRFALVLGHAVEWNEIAGAERVFGVIHSPLR